MKIERGRGESPPHLLVYRILGNDLPPMQSVGQTRWNVAFTLTHEPPPPQGVERRWLLNRIVSASERRQLRALLAVHGQIVDEPFPPSRHAHTPTVASNSTLLWRTALPATNQNAARNAALRLGAATGATWVLPLDGQVFITRDAWHGILAALQRASSKGHDVYQLPMLRLNQPQRPTWLNGTSTVASLWQGQRVAIGLYSEPQLGFRMIKRRRRPYRQPASGPAPFNDRLGYGFKNKREALDRLCSTGKSCECGDASKADKRLRAVQREQLARRCGVVVRLWFWPTADALEAVRSHGEAAMNGSARHNVGMVDEATCRATCDLNARLRGWGAVECILGLTACRIMLRRLAIGRLTEHLLEARNLTY